MTLHRQAKQSGATPGANPRGKGVAVLCNRDARGENILFVKDPIACLGHVAVVGPLARSAGSPGAQSLAVQKRNPTRSTVRLRLL